jgi:hypothetical protein
MIFTLLRPLLSARALLFATSMVFGLLSMAVEGIPSAILSTFSLAATAASLVIERYLYFTAVVAPKMPGSVSS